MKLTWKKYRDGSKDLDKLTEERRPGVLTAEELNKRDVTVLSYYDILTNEDNELMFTVKPLDSPRERNFTPCMFYDGGPHGILLKNSEKAVICDYVHPGVRDFLSAAKTVLICELSGAAKSEDDSGDDDSSITDEYNADVIHTEGVEELAGKYVKTI